MPFPCFWRRASSYNLKHDFDRVNKSGKSVSISRSVVLTNDKEIIGRRRTVLEALSHSESEISSIDPIKDGENQLGENKSTEGIPKKPISGNESENTEVKYEDTSQNVGSENEGTNIAVQNFEDKYVYEQNSKEEIATSINVSEISIGESRGTDINFENTLPISSVEQMHDDKDIDASNKENINEVTNRNYVDDLVVKREDDAEKPKIESFQYWDRQSKDEQDKTNEKDITTFEKNTDHLCPVKIVIDSVDSEDDKIERTDVRENDQNQKDESTLTVLVGDQISRSSSFESIEQNEVLLSSPERYSIDSTLSDIVTTEEKGDEERRRSGVHPTPVKFDDKTVKNLVKYPKSESDEIFIKDAIRKNEFLDKVISGRRLQEVVDAMYFKEFKAKEKIIKEGQRGGNMYVAAEGEFEVTKKGKGVVNVMKPGDVFGELAILYNAKRFASVRSITAAKAWVIDGTVYQQLVKKSNDEEQEEIVSFLQNFPILNKVGLDVMKRVASLLKPEFFEAGTTIVKEGERGDKFYIITAGSVTVTTESSGFVGQLYKGRGFGEKALLEPITRQATITADDPGTDCLTLTQKHFVENFGDIKDLSEITMVSQPQVPILSIKKTINEYSNLDLSEFKILKTLGVGGFGRVEFIQHKKDPTLTFALKCLKKYEMVQQEQQMHVIYEMQIQMCCNSPFIIRLYKTFKDNKYIYFLMEVCLGGDLWSLLQRQPNKKFTEKGARFISGCVLEALTYLHKEGFVYRDLKPENLLIDNNGYVKMTDFGFAKQITPGVKSGTFAGTPEYLAPEIILNRGHDKAVDLWAFGIFIFELLNGRTPFRSNDPSYMKTYNNILNGIDFVDFPAHNSSRAKSLICKLLKKAPSERLGIDEIKTHKWYAGFEWEKLQDCSMTSPYKPRLSSNVDCRYIDHFRKDNDIPPDENSWWDEYF